MTPAPIGRRRLLVAAAAAALIPLAGRTDERPLLSIVIDDLGDRLREGRRTVALPAPVACAFLPKTPHAHHLAEAAHRAGREVLLHMPMQAEDRTRFPGRLALHADAGWTEIVDTLREAMASVPHLSGMNNHMGSLVTRHPGIMRWVMEELRAAGDLYFLDSRTTPETVAADVARAHGVPALQRDVFLDNDPSEEAVVTQLAEAVRLARQRGRALAIGHPYPSTLDVLERELPRLVRGDVSVVAPRALLESSASVAAPA